MVLPLLNFKLLNLSFESVLQVSRLVAIFLLLFLALVQISVESVNHTLDLGQLLLQTFLLLLVLGLQAALHSLSVLNLTLVLLDELGYLRLQIRQLENQSNYFMN